MSGKARRREQAANARDRKAAAEAAYKVEIPEVVPSHLNDDTQWALTFKQFAVAENMFGVGDIPPLVSVYREGKQLLRAFTYSIDRDLGLEFARVAAPGFAADALTFTADAHMVDERFWEERGRGPDPHELQHICNNEGACDIGLTTDVIYMVHMDRAGAYQVLSFPYHVNKQASQVHWQPDVFVETSESLETRHHGIVLSSLRAFLNMPIPEFAELGIDEIPNARWIADMHVLAMLTMIGYPIMWATETDEERAAVDEFLSEMGLSGDGKPPTNRPPAAMQYMAKRAQMEMQARSQAHHAAELAEAARRRAERGEAPAEWATPKS